MALDKYAELKIAGNVLGFSMQDFANELNTYPQVVKDVCEGKTTSARISASVEKKIEEANKVFDQYRRAKKKVVTETA